MLPTVTSSPVLEYSGLCAACSMFSVGEEMAGVVADAAAWRLVLMRPSPRGGSFIM